VWAALTTAEGLAAWFGRRVSIDLRPGGVAQMSWDGGHAVEMFETYRTGGRGVEVMAPTYGLLDMTVFGRQENGESSPAGWPQRPTDELQRHRGRPTARWSRPGVLSGVV
jgi:predicted dithiol-disulfide oxidoreductase (DUF899 family)